MVNYDTREQLLSNIYAHIPKGRKCGGRRIKWGVTHFWFRFSHTSEGETSEDSGLEWKVVSIKPLPTPVFSWELWRRWPRAVIYLSISSVPYLIYRKVCYRMGHVSVRFLVWVDIPAGGASDFLFSYVLKWLENVSEQEFESPAQCLKSRIWRLNLEPCTLKSQTTWMDMCDPWLHVAFCFGGVSWGKK